MAKPYAAKLPVSTCRKVITTLSSSEFSRYVASGIWLQMSVKFVPVVAVGDPLDRHGEDSRSAFTEAIAIHANGSRIAAAATTSAAYAITRPIRAPHAPPRLAAVGRPAARQLRSCSSFAPALVEPELVSVMASTSTNSASEIAEA